MMVKENEEPIFIDVQYKNAKGNDERILEKEIRKLLEDQPFAVFATQGKDITDTSLISFAASYDLKHLVFATPVNTRKYDLVNSNGNVSILVDDRSQQSSINLISALTISGRARILSNAAEILEWTGILTEKHPYLTAFVAAPTTAVILVDVTQFNFVKKFQEVWKWDPR